MRCPPSTPNPFHLSLLLSLWGEGGPHSSGSGQATAARDCSQKGPARRRGQAASLPRTLPLGPLPLRRARLTGHCLLRFPHAEGAPGNPRLGRENGGGGSVGPKVVPQPRLGPWKPLGLPWRHPGHLKPRRSRKSTNGSLGQPRRSVVARKEARRGVARRGEAGREPLGGERRRASVSAQAQMQRQLEVLARPLVARRGGATTPRSDAWEGSSSWTLIEEFMTLHRQTLDSDNVMNITCYHTSSGTQANINAQL